MSFELEFATTRSGWPSRLKSPTATDRGPAPTPTGEPGAWLKPPPLPSPSRIVTLLEPPFVTTRSALSSRLKSPTATDSGFEPTATGEPGGWKKLDVLHVTCGTACWRTSEVLAENVPSPP